MISKVLPFWSKAVSSSKALKVLLIATLISLKMQNAQSWMIDSTFFFVKVTFERLWYEQTLFAHLIELVELLFLQSIKLIWYLDFFHIFISMSSWLEGEERELRSGRTQVQIPTAAAGGFLISWRGRLKDGQIVWWEREWKRKKLLFYH